MKVGCILFNKIHGCRPLEQMIGSNMHHLELLERDDGMSGIVAIITCNFISTITQVIRPRPTRAETVEYVLMMKWWGLSDVSNIIQHRIRQAVVIEFARPLGGKIHVEVLRR